MCNCEDCKKREEIFNTCLDKMQKIIKLQSNESKYPATCKNCSCKLLPSLNNGEIVLRCPICNSEYTVD